MNKFKKITAYVGSFLTVLAISPVNVMAEVLRVDLTNVNANYTKVTSLSVPKMISLAINVLLGSAGIIAFFMLIWGGIQWILSGGDKEGTEKARKRITGALIGLAIVFSAYALLFLVSGIFGVTNILDVSFETSVV